MEKVLITGGAGYIGSHVSKLLLNKDYTVVIIDNLTTGHPQSIDGRAHFYQEDIRNKAAIIDIIKKEKPVAVIHFAADSLVGVSMKTPLNYFNNNVYGTQILLEAMQETGINKIVFSSSAAIYGDQARMPLTEDSPATPNNPYGETKLVMEKIIKWCDAAYGCKYVSLRYFNAAGAYEDGSIGEDHRPETHLIPIVLQVALGQRESITIYGSDYETPDGTCIRDYIHVEDLADAHFKAIEYLLENHDSKILNLGSGHGQSVIEIINTAQRVTGKTIKALQGERRPGDPARLIASNQKALEALGWAPLHDLESIISSAWKYHQQHPHGY